MWKHSYRVGVLTASDKGAAGQREDKSGALIQERMRALGCEIAEYRVVADDFETLSQQLLEWSTRGGIDLILTTGGTGLSPRDCTPEATLAIADRLVPGISEAIRAKSMTITPRAMLSRGMSVICRQTLIINLPGSPKAVDESLDVIVDVLEHGLDILCSHDSECARS